MTDMSQPTYKSSQLRVHLSRRDEIKGEPVERYDIDLADGAKNVLVVIRVNTHLSQEHIESAAKWLGETCNEMSTEKAKFHGIVLYDNDDFAIDVVEVT